MTPSNLSSSTSAYSPWSVWATLLWAVAIACVFIVTQGIAAIAFIVSQNPQMRSLSEEELAILAESGDVLAVATLASLLVCGFLIAIAIKAKNGNSLKSYLHLHPISWRVMLFAVIAIAILMAIMELLNVIFDRPVPESMLIIYSSATNLLLLWLAIGVAAPILEEMFFRGFIHTGTERSFIGVSGTILLTALLWALVHIQYEFFEMFMIFLIGLLLGVGRWLSGSLYVPILMHMINNIVSLVQMHFVTQDASPILPAFALLL